MHVLLSGSPPPKGHQRTALCWTVVSIAQSTLLGLRTHAPMTLSLSLFCLTSSLISGFLRALFNKSQDSEGLPQSVLLGTR